MEQLEKLPIGLQNFRELRENNFIYVDKTEKIFELLEGAGYYFLSRPRRFGKSLLIDTLKQIFLGNKELFEGLWIENKIKWKYFPVIHFDFSKGDFKKKGLEQAMFDRIDEIGLQYDIIFKKTNLADKVEEMILLLSQKYQTQIVLLIDEYDKPIIDFLDDNEIEIAIKNREIMKIFYSPIKSLDKYIRFFLMTGVSKFTKVSIFSELNHLQDLTLHRISESLLGYTEKELHHYFKNYINFIANEKNIPIIELKKKIKEWYNGYNFRGKESVYNPFSILNFMSDREFNNYWFETGTPTFLVKVLTENYLFDVDNINIDLLSLGSFDIQNIDYVTVLFQTGYLTLKEQIEFDIFNLGYPNQEVKNAMLKLLLNEYTKNTNSFSSPLIIKLKKSFEKEDFEAMITLFNSLFAKIPYQIFQTHLESYYHSIIFLTFTLLG